jgi:hypothetical protein
MSADEAGQGPEAGSSEDLLRRLANQIEGLVRVATEAPPPPNVVQEGLVWMHNIGRGRQLFSYPSFVMGTVVGGNVHETPDTTDIDEAVDIDRIIDRLEAGIAKENEAMDALLSRLRTTRIAV